MGKAQTPRALRGSTEDAPAGEHGIYRRLLVAVRRRLGAQDAEDVVQDAFLRLASARERTTIREPDAFLHTVAHNLVRDRGRAAATRAFVSGDMDENVQSTDPDAWQILSSRQQFAVLERALAELPPKRRAALVLRRFDGHSHAEIADILGLSVSMVEKHLRAGLEHCRQRLAEANGDAP